MKYLRKIYFLTNNCFISLRANRTTWANNKRDFLMPARLVHASHCPTSPSASTMDLETSAWKLRCAGGLVVNKWVPRAGLGQTEGIASKVLAAQLLLAAALLSRQILIHPTGPTARQHTQAEIRVLRTPVSPGAENSGYTSSMLSLCPKG